MFANCIDFAYRELKIGQEQEPGYNLLFILYGELFREALF